MVDNSNVIPFLKWAGGKRWLTSQLSPLLKVELSKSKGVYFEPFLGAGAMFFSLQPDQSIISDINDKLVEVYNEVNRNWLAIVDELQSWPVTKETYYDIRSQVPKESFDRACRFLYLNRTCYGGLYRENSKGEFNVPFGGGERRPNALWEKNLLQNAASVLNRDVEIVESDFESVINKAGDGDVVYCDPTYSTKKRKQFDRYGKTVFDWTDQMRLAIAAEEAMDRGALVLISNSGCFQLTEFYPRAYRIELRKTKTIGNKASCNSSHKESLYILDPKSRRNHWQKLGKIMNRKLAVSVTPNLSTEINRSKYSLIGTENS